MLAVALLLCISNVSAHEVETRHGVIKNGVEEPSIEGGFTIPFQTESSRDTQSEISASFDLLSTLPFGTGKLSIYVEGNTTPRRNGVSSVLAETNGDTGSALNGNGDGRLQVSGLHYAWPVSFGYLYIGLINPTGFLDSSEVANDETRQFIGTSFINNPSIDFPDYTLGVAWHVNDNLVQPGLVMFFSSSNGLGDNPDASYSELIDVGDSGKSVFAAAELYLLWRELSIRSGGWINTADHERLNRPGSYTSNYGIYTSIDGKTGGGQWNLRLGIANEDVYEADSFVATTLEYNLKHIVSGVGIAHTWVSSQVPNKELHDMTHAEIYARFSLPYRYEVTPSLQWLHNSGFNASSSVDESIWIGTVRLTWVL